MNFKHAFIETMWYFVVLIMVAGIIIGGAFSLHGDMYGYFLFVSGLIMIPLYIWRIKKNQNTLQTERKVHD